MQRAAEQPGEQTFPLSKSSVHEEMNVPVFFVFFYCHLTRHWPSVCSYDMYLWLGMCKWKDLIVTIQLTFLFIIICIHGFAGICLKKSRSEYFICYRDLCYKMSWRLMLLLCSGLLLWMPQRNTVKFIIKKKRLCRTHTRCSKKKECNGCSYKPSVTAPTMKVAMFIMHNFKP